MDTIKNALCGWEENGYDDSDFFVACWDEASQSVVRHEIGSTRYAGGNTPVERATDPAVIAKALGWLEAVIYAQLWNAEQRDVNEPEALGLGESVRFLEARSCGKRGEPKVKVEAGARGDVFWFGHFGRFYRNGYNRPSRGNARVGVRLLDGRKVFVPMTALRRDREPREDSALQLSAHALASHAQFGKVLSPKHAWDSWNVAVTGRAS